MLDGCGIYQLILFVGSFLVILGILIFVFNRQIYLKREKIDSKVKTKVKAIETKDLTTKEWLEQNLNSDIEFLKNGDALFFTDYNWDFSGVATNLLISST